MDTDIRIRALEDQVGEVRRAIKDDGRAINEIMHALIRIENQNATQFAAITERLDAIADRLSAIEDKINQ